MTTRAASSLSKHTLRSTPTSTKNKKPTTTLSLICDKAAKDLKNNKKGRKLFYVRETATAGFTVCASISKKAFQEAVDSHDPFFCHYCRSNEQETEIYKLKPTFDGQKLELAEIEKNDQQSTPTPSVEDPTSSYANVLRANLSPLQPTPLPHPGKDCDQNRDRIIVYGIKECPKGSTRHSRNNQGL